MKLRKYSILGGVLVLALTAVFTTVHALSTQNINDNWQQINQPGFGNPDNGGGVLFTFNGRLYATSFNNISGTAIHRYNGSRIWTPVVTAGFGNANNNWVQATAVFNDDLYAGTENSVDGAELWRSNNGEEWESVMIGGFGVPGTNRVIDLKTFDGALYAATRNPGHGGQVWHSTNGSDWTQANASGFGEGTWAVYTLAEFHNKLYAGTANGAGGTIWRSNDGRAWEIVVGSGLGDVNNGIVYKLFAFNDYLYAATDNPATGAEVWRSANGETWEQVNEDGFGTAEARSINAVEQFGNALYMGVRNEVAGLAIFKTTNGTDWELVAEAGLGSGSDNQTVFGLKSLNGNLYTATWLGEVWQQRHTMFLSLLQRQ